ncbi:glycosyltransferase [Acinetobacter rudis]|uniref:Glycosyltransferase 2-like domain-containing protein n=1 Tax=Acinetobacter rudis CIP 110305 TaxID=421052 RepID=S3MTS4_9GAMM|nr:glycosyltransferase [Acinetobacter rudis]EPF69978.1 hypothetical protein F945_03542 [Acinetobacter rudis CIP 110305]
MIAVSIIVPCYNAVSKIGKCLASLRNIDFPISNFEVLFVDDCSTDQTYELLLNECLKHSNWSVIKLEKNSGSPSKPRNVGVQLAKGEYIFYFDCDDEILSDTIKLHYEHAENKNACIVRGALLVDNGKRKYRLNIVQDWSEKLSRKERIEKIIAKQSTTSPQLIKRKLLLDNNIIWPEDIKMGEDTIFLTNVLAHAKQIEYIDHDTFIYNKMPTFSLSTTQTYGKLELMNHLSVWERVQENLLKQGVDFYKIRLTVGLQAALSSLIFKNRGDIDRDAFLYFSNFINQNIEIIRSFKLNTRFTEIINILFKQDYNEFRKLCRPRVLIAGHDLKFIKPAEEKLSQFFDIKYDQWISHTEHDEKSSLELLEWAEIIWCEWMLGNSLWYSENKKNNQKLVIRVHRQELLTNYAEKINFSKVDLVMPVSVLFFERLLERFPNIPRDKVRLIPNYIDINEYKNDWNDDRIFNLAMIGILPSKKGFKSSLEILKKLRDVDPRFKLSIYSKRPSDLPWLMRNKEEMAYFDSCDEYIVNNKLLDAVEFKGHSNLKVALTEHKIGYILSLSESNNYDFPGFESFHLAVADGFAGGGISLINRWPGCEYIFPNYMIKDSLDEIVDSIVSLMNDKNKFIEISKKGREYINLNYSVDSFVSKIFLELSSIV